MNDLKKFNQIDVSNLSSNALSNITKSIYDEFNLILKKISYEYNLDSENLKDFLPEISKIQGLFHTKKRIRRTLPNDMMCLGRKLDGKQCTRARRSNSEYCLSHQKSLPNGRIDDNNYCKKEKGKRGRKKKYSDSNIVATRLEKIDGGEYLVDIDNNVYTYNIENPEWIGKKNILGSIDYFTESNTAIMVK